MVMLQETFDAARERDEILNARANELGKPRSELKPWVDYDPIWVDLEVQCRERGGGIWFRGD